MFTVQSRQGISWKARDIGQIHYNSYWRSYSIVLHVDEKTGYVWEQTLGETGRREGIRKHLTVLSAGDQLMTPSEYISRMGAD